MEIRKATDQDLDALTTLACRLWPDHSQVEMRGELANILRQEKGYSSLPLTATPRSALPSASFGMIMWKGRTIPPWVTWKASMSLTNIVTMELRKR